MKDTNRIMGTRDYEVRVTMHKKKGRNRTIRIGFLNKAAEIIKKSDYNYAEIVALSEKHICFRFYKTKVSTKRPLYKLCYANKNGAKLVTPGRYIMFVSQDEEKMFVKHWVDNDYSIQPSSGEDLFYIENTGASEETPEQFTIKDNNSVELKGDLFIMMEKFAKDKHTTVEKAVDSILRKHLFPMTKGEQGYSDAPKVKDLLTFIGNQSIYIDLYTAQEEFICSTKTDSVGINPYLEYKVTAINFSTEEGKPFRRLFIDV